MLIKSLVLKKDYLTTVNEKATLEEALKSLKTLVLDVCLSQMTPAPSLEVIFTRCTFIVTNLKVAKWIYLLLIY